MLAHAYLAVVRQHAIRGRGPRPRGRLAAPYGSRGAPAHLASRLGKAARSRSHPRLVELATPTPAARQTITLDPQNQNSSTPAVVLGRVCKLLLRCSGPAVVQLRSPFDGSSARRVL